MKKKKDKQESIPQSSWDVLEELDKEEREQASLSESDEDEDDEIPDSDPETEKLVTDEPRRKPEPKEKLEDASEDEESEEGEEELDEADREPTEILKNEPERKVFKPEIDLSEKKPEEDEDDEERDPAKASVGKKIFGIFTILLMLGGFALAACAFYFLMYSPSYVKHTNGDTLVYPELATVSDAGSIERLNVVATVADATFVPEIKKATEFDAVTEDTTEATTEATYDGGDDSSSDDTSYDDSNSDDSSDDESYNAEEEEE